MQTESNVQILPSTSCVVAQNLDIGYQGEVVVPQVNFQLTCGQSLALVGINGSGKTTLLKTIVGLLPPIKGEITVLGSPPGKNPQQLAYLSQFHESGFILPLRVKDVVTMGRYTDKGLFGRMTPMDDEIITTSMKRMGIEDLRDTPLRLLSGGQQQRAYMAQVLARQADLIVLDEPTSSLDASGRELFSQIMDEERSRGAMLVVATHDIQLAAECNQAMLLAHEVVAFGPGEEILTPEALLKTFGIVLLYQGEDKGVTIVEREHGHN
jgi:ABC-type Mn2+/Zn2+ transport system ATPase subunit